MSAPTFRSYRVSLAGCGAYAVWVTAESRRAACGLAERLWSENRSSLTLQRGGLAYVEILDEYDEAVTS